MAETLLHQLITLLPDLTQEANLVLVKSCVLLCAHHHTNPLSFAFPEYKPGAGCQILRTLQEPETDTGSVA